MRRVRRELQPPKHFPSDFDSHIGRHRLILAGFSYITCGRYRLASRYTSCTGAMSSGVWCGSWLGPFAYAGGASDSQAPAIVGGEDAYCRIDRLASPPVADVPK